jgi:hypothetical protein
MTGPQKLVLHYTRLQRVAIDKYFSLLGPFVGYEENVVLWIRLHAPLEVYLWHYDNTYKEFTYNDFTYDLF